MFLACFKNIFGYLLQYFWDVFWHISGNYFFNCFYRLKILTHVQQVGPSADYPLLLPGCPVVMLVRGPRGGPHGGEPRIQDSKMPGNSNSITQITQITQIMACRWAWFFGKEKAIK